MEVDNNGGQQGICRMEVDNNGGHNVKSSFEVHGGEQDVIKRTGTVWTATAHVITGVIGAGVLSLSWSTAQLGWIGGPLAIVIFAAITQVAILLVCNCYRSPDPVHGPARHRSLVDAVKFYLGKKKQAICGVFLMEGFYGAGIAYTIVTASSVKAIMRSNCYHDRGHNADCRFNDNMFMIMFGLVQIVVSQIPNFHDMAWLSIIAAIMSFCYASIGLGLGFATVVENRKFKGSISGVPGATPARKLWQVFQALGDIAFAYPYTPIVLEIQDTLKSPPSERESMKKVTIYAILITTFFYLCCACFGYAAFGDDTPGNLLTGFGFYEPYWLVDFANACIILHLVGGYQVYSQPVFAFFENWITKKFPEAKLLHKTYSLRIPVVGASFQVSVLRLCFRTVYVISTTGVAMLFPYFNQVLGVLGALNFWPIAIYFPIEMYLAQSGTRAWTRKWVLLQVFSVMCLMICVVGLVGSIVGLMQAKLGS